VEHKPDVMLLDVQMPARWIRVLEVVGRMCPWCLTATTSSPARLRVCAVDYLMKPFAPQRLREALDRVRSRQAATMTPTQLRAAAHWPGAPLDRGDRRDRADVHVLPISKIDYVEAQDDYVAFPPPPGGRC
jgi:two-component system LytT family response regulator